MSENNKTIQEALAEVQRNAELKRIEEAKKTWGDALQVDEIAMDLPPSFDPPAISGQRTAGIIKRSGKASGRFVQPQRATASSPKTSTASRAVVPSGSKVPATSSSSSSTPSTGGASRAIVPAGSKALDTTPSSSGAGRDGKFTYSRLGDKPILSGKEKVMGAVRGLGPITAAAIGGAQASNILGGLATGTETGRNIGSWIGKNVPGAKTAAEYMRKAGETIGVREPAAKPESPTSSPSVKSPETTTTTPSSSIGGRTGVGINKVMNREPSSVATPAASTAAPKEVPTIKAPAGPAKVAAPKVATPAKPATSSTPSTATTTKGGYFQQSPNVSKGDYTIKKGDTLSGIAKAQGTSVGAIQSMNKGLTDVNKIAAGGSLNLPTSTKSVAAPSTSTATTPAPKTPDTATPKTSETPIKDFVKNAMTGNYETPIKDAIKSKLQPEYESGGKKEKKKMSEDTNPLIASFLALQEKNASNMFVEAKKLSKKQKEKMDVDDDNDIDADDLAKLRSKKVEEESADYLGSSTVTKDKKGYVDPSTPKVPYSELPKPGNAAGDVLSKAKNALDKTGVKEETEEKSIFSQAEIDHINSFFLEASVAPKPGELAAEARADKLADGMSQNDVTGTAESGKKVRKEEVELDELYGKGKLDGILRGIETQQNVLNRKAKRAEYLYAASQKNDSHKGADSEKKYYMSKAKTLRKEEVELEEKLTDEAKANIRTALSDKMKKTSGPVRSLIKLAKTNPANVKEENLEEGRPKKNPEPESTDRDPRKHIQVEAGRAAAGNVVDFTHNDGTKSKITPAMGRRITSHLNTLKPADRQAAVNKMHDSAEGLKV